MVRFPMEGIFPRGRPSAQRKMENAQAHLELDVCAESYHRVLEARNIVQMYENPNAIWMQRLAQEMMSDALASFSIEEGRSSEWFYPWNLSTRCTQHRTWLGRGEVIAKELTPKHAHCPTLLAVTQFSIKG